VLVLANARRGQEKLLHKDDVIVGVDEQDSRLNTSEFLAYLLQSKAPGSQLALSVLRRGKRMHVVIPVIK
jgi:S1-C subfamily serine protease